MSAVDDPPRLFEADDAPAALRAALGAAHEDGIGLDAVERIAAGVEAQIGGPGSPPDPSSSTSGPDGSGSPSPGSGSSLLPTSPAGKLGAALVVAAVLGGGLWLASTSDATSDSNPQPAPPAVTTTAAPPSDPPVAARETALGESSEAEPADEAEPATGGAGARAESSSVAAPSRPSKTRPSLADMQAEHQLLRQARSALERDPSRAYALTQEHKRRFPNGMLAQEREVIAIQALDRMGKRSAARSRADQFGEQYPDSPHGSRVDAVTGDGGTKK